MQRHAIQSALLLRAIHWLLCYVEAYLQTTLNWLCHFKRDEDTQCRTEWLTCSLQVVGMLILCQHQRTF